MEKILLISGSPKKWNTYKLLSLITDSTKDLTEIILLKDKNIKECLWCWFCEKGQGCAIKDDMQEITEKLWKADTIVLWSPNYFANVSGITKRFIDRLLPLYHSQALKGKKIFLVMPWSSDDEENKKYLLQWTYGLVNYQEMNLLWAYGYCTEDEEEKKKKMEKIAKQIGKKISEK
jgi:multimeric flavodoxin WrbA